MPLLCWPGFRQWGDLDYISLVCFAAVSNLRYSYMGYTQGGAQEAL